MRKQVGMVGIALALMATPGAAQEGALIFGIGTSSCATWLHENSLEGEAWILGFFSGANTSRYTGVGSSTDARGVIETVRIRCELDPAAKLQQVTSAIYLEFATKE